MNFVATAGFVASVRHKMSLVGTHAPCLCRTIGEDEETGDSGGREWSVHGDYVGLLIYEAPVL